jgi:CHAT domain-containing protein/Flp pilus assembly protein TadD
MHPFQERQECARRRASGANAVPLACCWIPPVLILACLSACARREGPQSAFDHALETFRRGQVARAQEEAQAGYKQFHNDGPQWAWRFLLLQADALAWRGMNGKVLDLIRSETAPVPNGQLAVQKGRVEGAAYTALRRFPDAELKFDEAAKACATETYPDCVDIALDQGVMEMARGSFRRAEDRFTRALDLSREGRHHFKEATALLDLSWSALEQEHFDEAIYWCNAASGLSSRIGAADTAQNAIGNSGWAFYKLGEPERAGSLLLEAESKAAKLGDVTDRVKWLTASGYIYLDSGDLVKAEQSYKQALDLAQQTNKQDMIDALEPLAAVSEREGKLDQALDYANKTIALVPKDGNRLDVLYPLLIKGHVAARMHDDEQAEKIYREIEQDPKSHVFLKWESEHSLAQLFQGESKPDAAEREYRAALSTFEGARYALHEDTSLPFPANAAGIYDDYIHFLVDQGKTIEALQIAEYQRGRTLAEGLGLLQKDATFKPEALDAKATARKVMGTILFYWLGEKQSYLWAITPQKTAIFTLPSKSEIDPIAQRYRKALSEQQEFLPRTTDDGLALYHILVEPAANLLPRNAKVFIIPDGSLNTLNFETLLVPGATPHYWIEDVTITDASSLRLLAASSAEQKHADKLLLFGNAVAANGDYPELQNASAEMESIEKHFRTNQEEVFAREEATPAAYLASKPGEYSYIHFVAHGTANRMSPLDSAIVLSRSNAQEDSFKLYARDIIQNPLRAELVTISTCFGAGSRAYSGEGLVGLSWAFLRAGAHNVIGALWEVSDVSTPQLMDQLYLELEEGKSPDAALRDAKLALLRSSSSFRKPFYWAPFQLYTGS